jgi:hypothetical protein
MLVPLHAGEGSVTGAGDNVPVLFWRTCLAASSITTLMMSAALRQAFEELWLNPTKLFNATCVECAEEYRMYMAPM